mmetsp:Transcript_11383/g.11399  ORF Transcript_11383/g.11399 Transcript_11383/m.11399 type:complete len:83 (+) Transcript_11383:803-1051(+)
MIRLPIFYYPITAGLSVSLVNAYMKIALEIMQVDGVWVALKSPVVVICIVLTNLVGLLNIVTINIGLKYIDQLEFTPILKSS